MQGKIKLARLILVTVLNVLMVSTMVLINTSVSQAADRSAYITSVTTNQNNYAGRQIVGVTLTARNTGTGPVQLQGNVRIIDPNGNAVFNQSARYDLGARESDSNLYRWQIPQGAATGYYKVQAAIRDGNNNTQYDSGSTSFYYSGDVATTPNSNSKASAKITAITPNKGYYSGREIVTITFGARNIGAGPVQLRGLVQIFDPSGKIVFSQTARYDLAAGETDSNYFSWQIPEGAANGNYRILARITNGLDNQPFDGGLASFIYSGRSR
jgi:uncharacterized protein YfaS (alpha-2-macroglobulin family)